MKIYKNLFQQIISSKNLFAAWDEFRVDKRHKKDVQAFEFKLEQNIFQLHRDLTTKQYRHQPYTGFYIRDPKVRHIHKASARDRILHHAVFQVLNPIFDETFIPTSFSCRVGKGVHRGVLEMEQMIRAESRNFTRPCFALKCDVKKFFDTNVIDPVQKFLESKLKLKLHPKKISMRACHQGIDFLGYVALPYHRLMRTKTRKRIFRKLKARISQYRSGSISETTLSQSLQSYLGVLSHANTHQLSQNLQNQYWFLLHE